MYVSVMVPARNCTSALWAALIITLIFSSSSPLSISGTGLERSEQKQQMQRKKILGSRPPGCVNKCMNCRPCRATLVIPPHHSVADRRGGYYYRSFYRRDDDPYYLLSWKCKCGDKLFQP